MAEEFEDFYRREYAQVVRLAYALTGRYELAQEVAQDAFLAAERRWAQVSAYDQPGVWVRRVATNRSISVFRRTRNEVRALVAFARQARTYVELPEPDSGLWAAVRSLPRRQAQVFVLMFVEDRSPADVAELLGCSEETVRTHARRGRVALARSLESGWEED